MKIKTSFIMDILEDKNPVNKIGEKLQKFWIEKAKQKSKSDFKDYYYEGESEIKNFEEMILKSYWEFYDLLAKACFVEKNVFSLYPDDTIIIMDGMSFRESALLFSQLKNKYNVRHEFNFSALPSDTEFFRQKIKLSINNFTKVNNPNKIRIKDDEKYIWSYFPDVMLDKIKVGNTVISSFEELYNNVEKIVFGILEKITAKRIIITSDHGYLRTEAGFVFSVPGKVKKITQELFGGKRYIEIGEVDVDDLISGGYVKNFNGYYLVKSRYSWPVPGKFSVYIHGGLSLMECYTPVLIIER